MQTIKTPAYLNLSTGFRALLLGVGLLAVLGPVAFELRSGIERWSDLLGVGVLLLLGLSQVAHNRGRHQSARLGAVTALIVTLTTLSVGLPELADGGAALLTAHPMEWIGLTLVALGTTFMYTRWFGANVHTVLGASLPSVAFAQCAFGLVAAIAVPESLGVAPDPSFSFALIFLSATLYNRAVFDRTINVRNLHRVAFSTLVLTALAAGIALFVADSSLGAMVIALVGIFLTQIQGLVGHARAMRVRHERLDRQLEQHRKKEEQQRLELASAARESKEILDNLVVGVMKTLPSGKIIDANPALCDMLGFDSPAQMMSVDVRSIYADPDYRDRGRAREENVGNQEFRGDAKLVRRDGGHLTAEFHTRMVKQGRAYNSYFITCFIDVTKTRAAVMERERLETDLRLTHKLEAVGRLAAGVAHEINTPVQYIGDNVYFLREAYDDLTTYVDQAVEAALGAVEAAALPDVQKKIDAIAEEVDLAYLQEAVPGSFERTVEGVQSVARIVKSMKDYAYPNDTDSVLADINRLIKSTLTVTRSTYCHVAQVETRLADLPATLCFPGELNQVFVNLIVNASHAIEQANETLQRPVGNILLTSEVVDDSIVVRIGDDGTGMPEVIRARIFDPFFTTKSVGKGTGQGLAIARSIMVDKHGGDIDLESEPGKGTTFILTLPIRTPDMADA